MIVVYIRLFTLVKLCSGYSLVLVLCTLSLFVSVGKSRQWDPWLQRPSCHSKSQSHLWHWTPRSYYVWTHVLHLPGWERREARECGRGKCRLHASPPACKEPVTKITHSLGLIYFLSDFFFNEILCYWWCVLLQYKFSYSKNLCLS